MSGTQGTNANLQAKNYFRDSPLDANCIKSKRVNNGYLGECSITQDTKTQKVVLVKDLKYTSEEEFCLAVLHLQLKKGLRNKGLVYVLDYSAKQVKNFCSNYYSVTVYMLPQLQDLRKLIALRQKNNLQISEQELTFMLYHLTNGLAELHKAGLVHRIITPEAVDVTNLEHHEPKLIHFEEEVHGKGNLQIYNYIFKSRDLYLAPEVFQKTKELSNPKSTLQFNEHKLDAFSLGMTLLHAGLGESVQDCYDTKKYIFNEQNLRNHLASFRSKFSGNPSNPDHQPNHMLMDGVERLLDLNVQTRLDVIGLQNELPTFDDINAYFNIPAPADQDDYNQIYRLLPEDYQNSQAAHNTLGHLNKLYRPPANPQQYGPNPAMSQGPNPGMSQGPNQSGLLNQSGSPYKPLLQSGNQRNPTASDWFNTPDSNPAFRGPAPNQGANNQPANLSRNPSQQNMNQGMQPPLNNSVSPQNMNNQIPQQPFNPAAPNNIQNQAPQGMNPQPGYNNQTPQPVNNRGPTNSSGPNTGFNPTPSTGYPQNRPFGSQNPSNNPQSGMMNGPNSGFNPQNASAPNQANNYNRPWANNNALQTPQKQPQQNQTPNPSSSPYPNNRSVNPSGQNYNQPTPTRPAQPSGPVTANHNLFSSPQRNPPQTNTPKIPLPYNQSPMKRSASQPVLGGSTTVPYGTRPGTPSTGFGGSIAQPNRGVPISGTTTTVGGATPVPVINGYRTSQPSLQRPVVGTTTLGHTLPSSTRVIPTTSTPTVTRVSGGAYNPGVVSGTVTVPRATSVDPIIRQRSSSQNVIRTGVVTNTVSPHVVTNSSTRHIPAVGTTMATSYAPTRISSTGLVTGTRTVGVSPSVVRQAPLATSGIHHMSNSIVGPSRVTSTAGVIPSRLAVAGSNRAISTIATPSATHLPHHRIGHTIGTTHTTGLMHASPYHLARQGPHITQQASGITHSTVGQVHHHSTLANGNHVSSHSNLPQTQFASQYPQDKHSKDSKKHHKKHKAKKDKHKSHKDSSDSSSSDSKSSKSSEKRDDHKLNKGTNHNHQEYHNRKEESDVKPRELEADETNNVQTQGWSE